MNIRKKRIMQIFNSIKECSDDNIPASKKKLIAMLSIEYGTARRTALEYIEMLNDAGKIKIEGDDLWLDEVQQKI